MIGIYKLTSPSGKYYIGQSIDIDKRLSSYEKHCSKLQRAIYRAILKYGWYNFEVDILWSSEDTTNAKDILNELEQDFINLYDCIAPNGYNLKAGGNCKGFSTETRKLISDKAKGRITSDESKKKQSIARINYIQKLKEENKPNPRCIPIIQMDKEGNFIKEWQSAREAGATLNISYKCISNVLTGKTKTSGGYKWIKK